MEDYAKTYLFKLKIFTLGIFEIANKAIFEILMRISYYARNGLRRLSSVLKKII